MAIKQTCIPLCNAVGVYLEARSKDATDKALVALRKAYNDMTVADAALVEAARVLWDEGDGLEIHDGALTSKGEDGTWVQAWLWVEG